MPSQFGRQQRPQILDAHDAANLPEPVVDLGTGFSELLAGRLTSQQKRAFTAESAEMCKAQKVERVGPATLSPGVLSLEPAKTNRPGLFRVKTQSEFRKSFSKHPFDFFWRSAGSGPCRQNHPHSEPDNIARQRSV